MHQCTVCTTCSLLQRHSRSVFERRVSGYCISQNYLSLLLASVVWALYSSWSYKTELLSPFWYGAWNFGTIPPTTNRLYHPLRRCRGHSLQKRSSILRNAQYALQPYQEERPQPHYNLRNRLGINKSLIRRTVYLNDRDFLVRNLYKASYWTHSYIYIITALLISFLCYFMYYVIFATIVLRTHHCN